MEAGNGNDDGMETKLKNVGFLFWISLTFVGSVRVILEFYKV